MRNAALNNFPFGRTPLPTVWDPLGYLWFCTSDGLSRFDGYEFVNYNFSSQVEQLRQANIEMERRIATLEQLMLGQVQVTQTPKLH